MAYMALPCIVCLNAAPCSFRLSHIFHQMRISFSYQPISRIGWQYTNGQIMLLTLTILPCVSSVSYCLESGLSLIELLLSQWLGGSKLVADQVILILLTILHCAYLVSYHLDIKFPGQFWSPLELATYKLVARQLDTSYAYLVSCNNQINFPSVGGWVDQFKLRLSQTAKLQLRLG